MALTPRERQVLDLLKTGKRASVCADEIGITLGTFKVYASHVYQKMGVRGRLQLIELHSNTSPKTFMVPCSESFAECDYTFQ